MNERGDYVIPFFNGEYRFDKPPLTYWLQSSSYRLLGETELAARLPSVICAALAAAVLALLAGRFASMQGDPAPGRSAWLAAVVFSCSLQTIVHAKAAVADMPLVFFITTGFWLAWEAARVRGAARLAFFTALCAAMGLALLAKGPLGWTPLFLAGLLFARSGSRPGPVVGWVVLGIILPLLVVLPWGIPALKATGGEFLEVGVGRHVIERGVSAQEGHGSTNLWQYLLLLPFYFVTVFASFLPWSPALPGLVRAWRRREFREERSFLITILVFFVFFSLYKTKLPHYTLPVFPLLALVVARYLSGTKRLPDAWFLRRTAAMVGVVLLMIPAGHFGKVFFPSKLVGEIAEPFLAQGGVRTASVSYKEPSLVWYLRGHSEGPHEFVKERNAAAFLEGEGPRLLVVPLEKVETTPGLDRFTRLGVVEGMNLARGRPVRLAIYTNGGEKGASAGAGSLP